MGRLIMHKGGRLEWQGFVRTTSGLLQGVGYPTARDMRDAVAFLDARVKDPASRAALRLDRAKAIVAESRACDEPVVVAHGVPPPPGLARLHMSPRQGRGR